MADAYTIFLWVMLGTGIFVFITLFFENAGYGQFVTKKWGKNINNKAGWVIMEVPVIIAYVIIWLWSDRRGDTVPLVFTAIFMTHYINRTFIFPYLIRGKDVMPWSIISFGMIFNTCNAIMQGVWIFFYITPAYDVSWLSSPQFIIGFILFIIGFIINLNADHVVRNLRPKGETGAMQFKIPRGGVFDLFKVSSPNYLGEFTEWLAFGIMTWSPSGFLFAAWTFFNLFPRAYALRKWYIKTFGEEFTKLNRKIMLPWIL